jgi:hypothetical protein
MRVPFETICTLLPSPERVLEQAPDRGMHEGLAAREADGLDAELGGLGDGLLADRLVHEERLGRPAHIWQVRLQYSLSAMSIRS